MLPICDLPPQKAVEFLTGEEPGSYLLRNSSSEENAIVISAVNPDAFVNGIPIDCLVVHYRVYIELDGKVSGFEREFANLQELLDSILCKDTGKKMFRKNLTP